MLYFARLMNASFSHALPLFRLIHTLLLHETPMVRITNLITQQIVTMSKYGQNVLVIRHPYITDVAANVCLQFVTPLGLISY